MLIYGTNFLSYHELSVAGEVLLSAPSRARRVISDQIFAMDVTSQISNATSIDELDDVLTEAAPQFGFLAMELARADSGAERQSDHIHPVDWGWKLDYPIRLSSSPAQVSHVLSIWCRSEVSHRPYGAERVARVLGPAIQDWFDVRGIADEPAKTVVATRKRGWSKGRLKLT
jgi:hypothetical protein